MHGPGLLKHSGDLMLSGSIIRIWRTNRRFVRSEIGFPTPFLVPLPDFGVCVRLDPGRPDIGRCSRLRRWVLSGDFAYTLAGSHARAEFAG